MEFHYIEEPALEDYFKHTFQKKLLLYMPQREKEHLTPATQILEKRRELEEVEKARKSEKEEFRMKMESLAARRDEIEIRENQLKESLLKFDAFIKENDAKLLRARNKACRERETITLKEREIVLLKEEVARLQQELNRLKNEVEKYSKFHDFLHAVMSEAGGYDEPRSVMTRHKTLTALLVTLRVKERLRGAMLETFRTHLMKNLEDIEDGIMLKHNTVSKLQKQHELAQTTRLHWENEYAAALTAASDKTMLEGKLRMAARNMYKIIRARMHRAAHSEDFCDQMTHVGNYMTDLKRIIQDLNREKALVIASQKAKEDRKKAAEAEKERQAAVKRRLARKSPEND